MDAFRHNLALFRQLLRREIRSRFIGSATGWIWLIVTPLLLLAVYGFVFGVIFQARAPADMAVPFIAWLAVALWPWLAFSEGVLKGSQAILQNSALISKVSLPRALLVISSVSSVFFLHLIGYLVILIAVQLLAADIAWHALPNLTLTLFSLYLLALGLGLMFAAVQVYLRDLEHFLPTFFMLWFFLTPILYAPEILPGDLGRYLAFNPMTWWMEEIRQGVLLGQWWPGTVQILLLVASLVVLWLGLRLFDRLSPHFEDFL